MEQQECLGRNPLLSAAGPDANIPILLFGEDMQFEEMEQSTIDFGWYVCLADAVSSLSLSPQNSECCVDFELQMGHLVHQNWDEMTANKMDKPQGDGMNQQQNMVMKEPQGDEFESVRCCWKNWNKMA